MRILWLEQAVEDLAAARKYIAENNPTAATEMAERIRQGALMLGDYPAAGRPGRVPNTRELVMAGTPYILPYRVRADAVEILRVLHGARRWQQA